MLSDSIIVALISLTGSAIGTFSGIIATKNIIAYRLEQLEKKVEKHNNYAERMPICEEQIKVINHRLTDIEREIHNYENKI